MLEVTPTTELRVLLRESIRLIKKARPHASTSSLAVSLDIPGSTLSRIENGGTRRPEFKHAMAVLTTAYGEEKGCAYAAQFYPELMENFEKIYSGNKEVPFVDSDSEKYFQDPTTYELMIMATSDAGIDRERVKDEFGKKGITILEELLEQEVLTETNGTIALKGNINARQPTVHKLVQNLITHNYDLAAFGKKENWLSLQYESVDLDKAMPKVREILQSASAKIREVLNDPSYKGKDVLWASMSSDSLIKQGPKREELQ